MPSDCPYCGKPHFNFGDDEEGVEALSVLRTADNQKSIHAPRRRLAD